MNEIKPKHSDDAELVSRLLEGDEDAFSQLVTKYHSSLIRLAMVFVSDRSVAEEVVQDTWLGVLRGLPGFQGRGSLKSWIYRILTNQARRRGTREGRTVNFTSLRPDDDSIEPERFAKNGMWTLPPKAWDVNTPEKLMADRESLGVIEGALKTLPPNQRAVVVMRDVLGTPSAEVCDILEVSEANQRVLLHRGRSRVRRALEKYLEAG